MPRPLTENEKLIKAATSDLIKEMAQGHLNLPGARAAQLAIVLYYAEGMLKSIEKTQQAKG